MIKKPLIFLHIPKTGGWTLHNVLTWVYMGHGKTYNVTRNSTLSDFKAFTDRKRNKYAVMKGHMPFGGHHSFPEPEKVYYMTMMRDPVKRIISSYHYIKKLEIHPLHKKLVESKYSLKEYVESGIIANTENAQLRMISGHVDTLHGACTREMLQEAKDILKHKFAIVGLNEAYDESLLLMKKILGWRNPYYLKANVTGHGVKPADLDQGTMDTIIKYNALDIELYQYAKALFEEKVQEYPGSLKDDVDVFRRKNARAQVLIKLKRKIY